MSRNAKVKKDGAKGRWGKSLVLTALTTMGICNVRGKYPMTGNVFCYKIWHFLK
jgi:hypothetical protein